jgi:hypothetical protein
MSDQIQSVRAIGLNHSDPRVRKFMQEYIQKQMPSPPPPLPKIDPPPASSCARPQSDLKGGTIGPLPEQPAPQQEIGQPRACGATDGLFGGQAEPPRDLREIEPPPKSAMPQRDGKWRGGSFDPENDPELQVDEHIAPLPTSAGLFERENAVPRVGPIAGAIKNASSDVCTAPTTSSKQIREPGE